MAEREAGRPAPDTLSTEEADRLSERFRPSWEPDPPSDPPTVPRAVTAPLAKPLPKPAAVLPKPIVPPAHVAAKPAPAAPLETVVRARRSPTLVGIQPTIPVGPRPTPDDLDWEAPTQPAPSVALDPRAAPASAAQAEPPISIEVEELPPQSSPHVDVEELPSDAVHTAVLDAPPPSKPSGIGRTYVPKDQDAPAVVLKEDVRAAEEQARAELEARHRSRRVPTIVRMRAVDIPIPPQSEEVPFAPSKRRKGLWFAAGAFLLVAVTGGALVLRSKPQPSRADAPPPEQPVAARAENEAATALAAEPAPAVAALPAPGTNDEAPPDASASPLAGAGAAPQSAPATPAKEPARSKSTKAASAGPTVTSAKPARPAPKPASKVIVRETPF
jgi:hypothetical protein